jgi:hypothetical protein
MDKYIKVKTFEDFCKNQKKLIDILNHNMTKMEVNMSTIKNDVCWMKKILWAIFGIVVVSFVSIIIKAGLGV